MSRLSSLFVCVFLTTVAVGCGGASTIESRATAQESYDAAIISMEAKDYANASANFTLARSGSGLPIDLYTQSGFAHAQCLTELELYEDALAALDSVREGAEEEDILIARAKIFVAQNDMQAAKAEYAAAKALNPRLKIPKLP